MIINLFFWFYISFICFVWGNIMYEAIKKIIADIPETAFSITCLAGLSIVGVIAFYLSLFIPLNWIANCVIIFPVLIYCLFKKNRNTIKLQILSTFKSFSPLGYSLLLVCILMTLIISASKIIHPDTLAYHAQLIQWFQAYKAVPGIVNLKLEFGFQSLFFATQAIFKAVNENGNYFSLGGCVVCWYFIFIIKKIDAIFLNPTYLNYRIQNSQWGWLLLLTYTLFSFTQVRLTIASASPDFIVTLLLLVIAYLFFKNKSEGKNKIFYLLLVSFFSCIAFTTKLSSACILLLPIGITIYFFYNRNFKIATCIGVLSTLIIIPFLVRNIVSSGYLLYPSSFPDFFNADWKLKISNLYQFQNYITSYARYPVTFAQAQKNIQISFVEWIPIWWKHIAIIDCMLLCGILLLLLLNIIFLKSFVKKLKEKFYLYIFLIFSAGSIVWFIKAPDPRFGTGFLIPLLYLLYLSQERKINLWINKINPLIYKGVTCCMILLIMSYSVYRIMYFLNKSEIIYPAGIEKVKYKKIDYNNINVYLITDTATGCGITPVPCITDTSQKIIMRGSSITNGFKSKQ